MITRSEVEKTINAQIYRSAIDGKIKGAPPFPSASELDAASNNIFAWASIKGLDEAEIVNRLARVKGLPLVQLSTSLNSATQENIERLRSKYKIQANTELPWIPLGMFGPFIFIGHFAPHCDDTFGLPDNIIFKVVLHRNDYETSLEAAMKLIGSPASGTKSIPAIEPTSENDYFDFLIDNNLVDHAEQLALMPKADARNRLIKDASVNTSVKAKLAGYTVVPPACVRPTLAVFESIPNDIMMRVPMLCYHGIGSTLYVVMPNPDSAPNIEDQLNSDYWSSNPHKLVASYMDEQTILERIGSMSGNSIADLTNVLPDSEDESQSKRVIQINPSQVQNTKKEDLLKDPNLMVQSILYRAIIQKASDVHLEWYGNETVVRVRANGNLLETTRLPYEFLPKLNAIIKLASDIPVAERKLPQDGKLSIILGKQQVDGRVSLIPHYTDQTCVIRLNPRTGNVITLDSLKLNSWQNDWILEGINAPSGIVIVTGPTGSGKSSTLYACLNYLNTRDVNIVTIEDPIEVKIDGLKQFQVNNKIDLTFSRIFKGVLRHDPDIVMVGEIRDKETALEAIKAANTGHLVFTTLHTNDAPSVIDRLETIGIERDQIASSIVLLQAQRLVRILCPSCAQTIQIPHHHAHILESVHQIMAPKTVMRANPKGCPNCSHTGYMGRRAIMELCPGTPEFLEAVAKGAKHADLIKVAEKVGYRTLYEEGLALYAQGLTSYEEARGWHRAFSELKHENSTAISARANAVKQISAKHSKIS